MDYKSHTQYHLVLSSITVIAYRNYINQITSRSIVRPRNAVTNITPVPPLACKIVKIRTTPSRGLSISQAPCPGPGHSRRLSQKIFGEPKQAIGSVGSPTWSINWIVSGEVTMRIGWRQKVLNLIICLVMLKIVVRNGEIHIMLIISESLRTSLRVCL